MAGVTRKRQYKIVSVAVKEPSHPTRSKRQSDCIALIVVFCIEEKRAGKAKDLNKSRCKQCYKVVATKSRRTTDMFHCNFVNCIDNFPGYHYQVLNSSTAIVLQHKQKLM